MTLSTVARRLDPARLRSLAAHAALVGALAGILAAGFVSVAGEPALLCVGVIAFSTVVGFAVLVAEADSRLRRPGAAIVSDALAPAPT